MPAGARDSLHRELGRLRDENALLAEQVRQLTDAVAPPTMFPPAWRLTPQEERCLSALFAADTLCTKERLHIAISGDLERDTDEKLVDVVICKVRAKLARFGVAIDTRWGEGYYLEPAGRAAIAGALADPLTTSEETMSRDVALAAPPAGEALRAPGEDGDLLSVAGGLILCARHQPRHAALLLDAAAIVLEGARAEIAGASAAEDHDRDAVATVPPPAARQASGAASVPPAHPPQVAPTPSVARSAPPERADARSGGLVAAEGAVVSTEKGEESISFDGRVMELTPGQAALAALLVRASPHPVDRDFLMTRLWGGPSVNRDQTLGSRAAELRGAVASLGLVVKTVRGVSISIGAES